jgi:CO dehydrogenase maturation factor
VKIAFVGKGGSGKTTLASLFARHLAAAGLPVLAIDADVNQHLGVALGLEEETAPPPAMGDHLEAIKDDLRGDNPRIRSTATMVKTTPPGRGSRLLLNHLVDGPGEYVVVDMTAGADCFASGLFTRFDRTFLGGADPQVGRGLAPVPGLRQRLRPQPLGCRQQGAGRRRRRLTA